MIFHLIIYFLIIFFQSLHPLCGKIFPSTICLFPNLIKKIYFVKLLSDWKCKSASRCYLVRNLLCSGKLGPNPQSSVPHISVLPEQLHISNWWANSVSVPRGQLPSHGQFCCTVNNTIKGDYTYVVIKCTHCSYTNVFRYVCDNRA